MRIPYVPQRLPDPTQHRYRVGVKERTPLLTRPVEERFATPHMESLHVLTWRMSDDSEMSEVETPELALLRAAIEDAEAKFTFWAKCNVLWARLKYVVCLP